jgi:hypothetical protein
MICKYQLSAGVQNSDSTVQLGSQYVRVSPSHPSIILLGETGGDDDEYFGGNWVLTHIKGVDNFFAAATHSPRPEQAKKIRLDFDGFGATAATAHDEGENVNASIWIDVEDAEQLTELIDEAIQDGDDRLWKEANDE